MSSYYYGVRLDNVGVVLLYVLFFFNDPATTEIYTLSLHDALPISNGNYGTEVIANRMYKEMFSVQDFGRASAIEVDRKSTRLNSSHMSISYAVFCLKKKKKRPLTTLVCKMYSSVNFIIRKALNLYD